MTHFRLEFAFENIAIVHLLFILIHDLREIVKLTQMIPKFTLNVQRAP